ncbi:PAZ domain-containing protein [Tanacetum coccineum]|uniref:PAZ domain-containing protein n=1 Tax=Tanacetum coccineum TaxID=301880 RepID=A0ABQ5IKX6_9ASTR
MSGQTTASLPVNDGGVVGYDYMFDEFFIFDNLNLIVNNVIDSFINDMGATKTVAQYFQEKYYVQLLFPVLPAIQAGTDVKSTYLLMEVYRFILLLIEKIPKSITMRHNKYKDHLVNKDFEHVTARLHYCPSSTTATCGCFDGLASSDKVQGPCLCSYAQPDRQEIIRELHATRTDPERGGAFDIFQEANGDKPHSLIFYKDGVACISLSENCMSPVTFIVVQKRHHTRFFHARHDDRASTNKSGNILPGTVVEAKICHPRA